MLRCWEGDRAAYWNNFGFPAIGKRAGGTSSERGTKSKGNLIQIIQLDLAELWQGVGIGDRKCLFFELCIQLVWLVALGIYALEDEIEPLP